MTSNYEPSTLYPDGLHRDRILPAIKLIQERMDVVNVDVGTDYRRRAMEQVRMYLMPITAETRQELQDNFDRLMDTASLKTVLVVENSEIKPSTAEQTSELKSLKRILNAVNRLKTKKKA